MQHKSNTKPSSLLASDTVMAEQLSHNVVNGSESASALALADVATNHITAASALSGPHTVLEASQNQRQISPSTDDLNNPTPNNATASDATDPSAGSVAELATKHEPFNNTLPSHLSDTEQFTNGVYESNHVSTLGDDASIADQSIDLSVNSDTDVGRADGSDVARDGHDSSRANPVKKPTTFSKVSVTKTFLAKSATPQPTQTKLGDKPSISNASTPALARPRLVAKTVGSLQNVQKANMGANGASGPDASKVWNKNRPVVPIPPKQLTDEQLKQQYGIHLATRLQTNENGKDSTWADIDDDDDDWAPETVVWVDGTKSSLNPAEAPVPVAPPKPVSPAPVAKPIEAAKPTLVVKRATDLGPSKTILKPGIAAQQAKQQGTGAAPGEKPILKAKSPAPAPTKSPWASIPAVEAVSPITPPIQQSHAPTILAQPLPPQDARAYDSSSLQPAREIAADTFERSSLGNRPEGASRELFNSANGRYEPAPERRSSLRPERKTAVLQRPPHVNGQATEMPAPTRHGNQVNGPWARRRESNQSQNSNPVARRMSISRSVDSSQTPDAADLAVDAAQIANTANFSKQSPWHAQLPPRPENVEPEEAVEDPVQVQERVMREKREMAIQRRKEQEEKEEAERKERLRAKLSALEGAGKSRKEREAEAAEKKSSEVPVPTKNEPAPIPTRPVSVQEETPLVENAQSKTSMTEPTPPAPISPTKGVSAEPPVKLPPTTSTELAAPSVPESAAQPNSRPNVSPATSGRANFVQPQGSYKTSSSAYPSPGDRKSQPFGRSPLTNSDTFSPWGTVPSGGNIWGSSGMGNGTFETASAFAPLPMQNSSTLPPPLGMSMPGSARISPEAQGQENRSTNLQQSQASEPLRNFPSASIDSRPESSWGSTRTAGTSQAPGANRPPHGPGPIAPPSRSQQQQHTPPSAAAPGRAAGVAAWNTAARSLPYQYGPDAKSTEQREGEPSPPPPPPQHAIKETFKRTVRDNNGVLGGPRRYESTEFSVHDAHVKRGRPAHSPAPPNAQTQPTGPFTASSTLEDIGKPQNTLAPIGPPQRAVPAPSSVNVNFPTAPLPSILPVKDQSQPPPETASHPVNDNVSARPKVRLPPPPAIVKLPPMPTQSQVPPIGQPRSLNAWGPLGVTRPIAQTPDWQARFNGLFDRTPIHTEVPPSPPGTPPKAFGTALAVTSSSKAFFDEVANLPAATVALPPFKDTLGVPVRAIGLEAFTKSPIEPSFNDELSFGSLPKVNLPKNARYGAHVTSASGYNLLQTIPAWKVSKTIQPQSIAAEIYFYKAPQGYYLRIPGTNLNNVLAKHAHDPTKSTPTSDRKTVAKFLKTKSRETPSRVASAGMNSGTQTKTAVTPSPTASPLVAAGQDGGRKRSTWSKSQKPRSQVAKA